MKYKPIRKVGEKPNRMGLFEVVAPSDASRELESLIKVKSGANNPLNIDWNNSQISDQLIHCTISTFFTIKKVKMKSVSITLKMQ